MFGLGTTELLIIGVIIFLIFGAKRLPEIGKGLGGALREFKQVKKQLKHEEESENDHETEEKGEQKEPPDLENKLTEKVIEQTPGVKKVMDVKKRVDKVKDIIKS
ncbi:MAG: twin-arginine translocase TatA/TatE family subunit [Desulfobacteraceae bacterium]|jgi:sec-independent protein translocase protein TatA